ncbi:TPA: DUF4411 family protein [Acinetobacter baumannii]|uniref:DUF4411 family protein n=1 Tax=Acinetobacter baumannii TaxID=470 RepID=UPI000A354F3C|nr:DUF4411 family protein [Acinetobacter baumannii]EHU2433873.1 DUF4411 family protein [Acinetobacter baumannii]EHU2650836.1 DUF4411 family protein [Acinetobacter baumannii]EIB6858429.1 DUF4411 family protein [Acinetobacter baumannii]EIB6924009.1 DUF4411 family protein [Acinetobacter baumannii]EJB8465456.1 DUF4411 family protein [Acinetobacter baumannii]
MVDNRYILDASTLIDIWFRFPKELKVFNSLWEQIESLVISKSILVTRRNFEEVKHKSEEAYNFFNSLDIEVITPNQEILITTVAIQQELGITDAEIKNNLRDGVDEGDLICIATAKCKGMILVTEEKRQPVYPGNKGPNPSKYKIPKVCEMPSVNVKCINFLDFLDVVKDI